MLIGHSLSMQRKNIVKDGLVLWLEGKDFTNSPPTSLLRDRSGNRNNATPIGMAYTSLSGSDGNGGIIFDGVNDYLNIGTLGDFGSKLGSDFTIGFDIKTTSISGAKAVLATFNSDAGNSNNAIQIESGEASPQGGLSFLIRDINALSMKVTTVGNIINDGLNHHVIWVKKGNLVTDQFIYIDNVLVSLTTIANQNPVTFVNFNQFMPIGARNLRGSISIFNPCTTKHLYIYTKALTDAERTQNYNLLK